MNSDRIWIDALNTLSTSTNTSVWIDAFRKALLKLVPDADHVSVSINLSSPLDRQRAPLIQGIIPEAGGGERKRSNQAPNIVDTFRQRGLPVEQFHEPAVLDYFDEQHGYLGSVIFWIECAHTDRRDKIERMVRGLDGFMRFLITDFIVRQQAVFPNN